MQIGPLPRGAVPRGSPSKDPYALRITCNDREGHTVFSYSGDTDLCEGLVKAARGADLFLCEAAYQEGRDDALRGIHLTGKRAGEAATEAGVRNLLLTHLPVERPGHRPRGGAQCFLWPGRHCRNGGKLPHLPAPDGGSPGHVHPERGGGARSAAEHRDCAPKPELD